MAGLKKPHLPIVIRVAAEAAARMPSQAALLIMLFHFLSSWAGYFILGEEFSRSMVDMVYYYVVTGSSVGYGDLSPATAEGRLFGAVWVIPGALAGFAWFIGKAIIIITSSARKIMTGTADYSHKQGHNLIIGYVFGETEKLISELPQGQKAIIVSDTNLEGKVPKGVDWVHSQDLSDEGKMRQAGFEGAHRVMVLTDDDDVTMSVCLSICQAWPEKRVVSLFKNERKASLVRGNCRSIETVTSPSASLMARAVDGPGTASVIERLLSSKMDDTLGHAIWDSRDATVSEIRDALDLNQCLLIAVEDESGQPDLIPDVFHVVKRGQSVYYLGKRGFSSILIDGTTS